MLTKHSIKFLILFMINICVYSGMAAADGILFVSPTRVELTDNQKVAVIAATNQSQMTRAYKISTEDMIMTAEGVTAPVDNFEYSAKRMIRFVPRQFTLEPGQRQTIRIMSRLRRDMPEGDYHTHMRFLEDITKRKELNAQPSDGDLAAISAPISYEAMIPVIVSHGNVSTSVGMKDVSLSKDSRTGDPKISLTLTREGNGQGVTYIDTDYIAPDGTVSKATVRRTTYIYREIEARKRDYTLSLDRNVSGGKLRLTLYSSPDADAKAVDQITIPYQF